MYNVHVPYYRGPRLKGPYLRKPYTVEPSSMSYNSGSQPVVRGHLPGGPRAKAIS